MEENYLPCCFCCLPLLPPLHFVVGLCTLRRLSFSSTHSHTATTIKRAHPPCFFLNNDSTTDRLDVIFDQRFFSTKFICVYIKKHCAKGNFQNPSLTLFIFISLLCGSSSFLFLRTQQKTSLFVRNRWGVFAVLLERDAGACVFTWNID